MREKVLPAVESGQSTVQKKALSSFREIRRSSVHDLSDYPGAVPEAITEKEVDKLKAWEAVIDEDFPHLRYYSAGVGEKDSALRPYVLV